MNMVCRSLAAAAMLVAGTDVLAAQQSSDTTMARQQKTIDSLTAALAALAARVDTVASQPAPAAAAPASGSYMNVGFVSLTDAGWSTAKNIPALQLGDHDPKVRGFTLPNSEISLDGNVDPYFKGFSNIVFKLNDRGETEVELEEAFGITQSLSHNLQLKFGQFFPDFGRQNAQHPHSWAFVDDPLVLARMFGPDGLRSQGIRLSWLLPTSFYTEAAVSVMNSSNGTAFSFRSDESSEIHGGVPVDRPVNGPGDMLIVPHVSSSFDLSDTQTLLVGASGAFGPNNSGDSARTAIYGVDGYWKWKSPTAAAGFPFFSLQGEALLRNYEAAARQSAANPLVSLPAETLRDGGVYAQALWGIRPRIVAGLRADLVNGNDAAFTIPERAERFRLSPNFTWYPTEFSKFRIQYNYDDRKTIGTDHSLWVQFEFLLGAHAAHKF
jgi:hypothetical protein